MINMELDFALDSPFPRSEVALKRIKEELIKALHEVFVNRGIVYLKGHDTHLGDNYITAYVLDFCLRKFMRQNGINGEIKVSTIKPEPNTLTLDLTSPFDRELPSQKKEAYQRNSRSYLYGLISYLSDLLDLEWNEEELWKILSVPPLPIRNYDEESPLNPMRNYDERMVSMHIENFRKQIDLQKPYLIITHGGSKGIKRMGRDQVRYVLRELRQILPEYGTIILTAQSVDGNGGPELRDIDADLVVDATEDINKTIALFKAPKSVLYVTMDTFLAWLGAGSIASRVDHAKILNKNEVFVLYTIASSEFWGIPGVNKVESQLLESRIKELMRSGFHLINDEEYLYDPNHLYESKFDPNDPHVRMEDLEKLINTIKDAVES